MFILVLRAAKDPLFLLLTFCLLISLTHILVAAWQYHEDDKSVDQFLVFLPLGSATSKLLSGLVFMLFGGT